MTRRRIVRRVVVGWTLPTGGAVDVVEIAAVTRDRCDVHAIEVCERDPGSAVPRELLRAVTPRELAAVAPLLATLADAARADDLARCPAAWWIARLRDVVDEAAARDGVHVPRGAPACAAAPAATARAEASDVQPARIRRGPLALLA